jgi:hypothetical protein
MCAALDIFLLLCINCLSVSVLDLLELIVSAEERVAVLGLEVLDGRLESQGAVERVSLQEAIVNFEEIDLILVE